MKTIVKTPVIGGVWCAAVSAGSWLCLAACGAAEPVELRVSAYQSTAFVAEPVVIAVTLTNGGNQPALYREPNLETRTLRVFVRPDGGQFDEYRLAYVKDPRNPVTLAPSAEHRLDETLHYNYKAKRLAFPQPGNYTIRADYSGLVGIGAQTLSAETTVQILAAPPGEEVGAQLFSDKKVIDVVAHTSRDREAIQRLQEFAAAHPNSRYSPYANYFVGSHRMTRYDDKPSEWEEAERLMKRADRDGFPLRHSVLLSLAAIKRAQGQNDEALAYLDEVVRRFPKTAAAQRAVRRKDEYRASPAPEPKRPPASALAPLPQQSRDAIAAALEAYFKAYQERDAAACLALLHEDFLYNNTLGRDALAAELREDFIKFGAYEKLQVRQNIKSIQVAEAGPVADLTISLHANGQELAPPAHVKIGLVNEGDRWLLLNWKRLKN